MDSLPDCINCVIASYTISIYNRYISVMNKVKLKINIMGPYTYRIIDNLLIIMSPNKNSIYKFRYIKDSIELNRRKGINSFAEFI